MVGSWWLVVYDTYLDATALLISSRDTSYMSGLYELAGTVWREGYVDVGVDGCVDGVWCGDGLI